jgi:TRAP-type C4-dicarboxylate transport system substrate-binding protein
MKRILLLACAILMSACAPAPPPGVTVLTYATPYSPQHPFSKADQIWMKWVEQASNGSLRIQPYWSGSLLSSEHSMAELRHGVADIGLITPIYARGGTHLIRVHAGFYAGTTTFEQQVALYRCLVAAEPQFDRELHDLKVLAVQGGNLPGIITREKPVRSLADLQGLRLRAPSELLDVLKHLGADPVDMPMGEVYSALAKGVLDGVIAPADTFRSLHFGEVTKYFNTLRIPRGAYAARAMSAKRFASLSKEHRDILEAGIEVWERAMSREIGAADQIGIDAAREAGVEFIDMPPEDQARFATLYNQDAEARARGLERFGIDGLTSFRLAGQITADLAAHGTLSCNRSPRDSSS